MSRTATLTPEQRKENRRKSVNAYNARRAANNGPLGTRPPLTPEERREHFAAATRRWRERHPERAREKSRLQSQRYALKHPEKIKEANRLARLKNKEQKAAYMTAYSAAHKEEKRAYMKDYMQRNKAKVAAKRKDSYEANRDRLLAEKRVYYVTNRARIRADASGPKRPIKRHGEQIRRARKAGASIGDEAVIARWQESWRAKPFVRCYWCKTRIPGNSGTADHIRPLARGGEHSISNLCVACGSCNSKKHARDLTKWNAVLTEPVLL